MTESDFTLNGSLDRYSYSVSSYCCENDSTSSNRFEMDAAGTDLASSLNHTLTSTLSVKDYIYMNESLSDGDTLQSLYEVPTGVTALLSLFYGSISVIAVVGNSLVMWIVATSRRMQNVTNCFIANLALADIVIGLFAIPFQVSRFTP
jgi:leucokinin receptor